MESVIIHVPHSSEIIPDSFRAAFVLPEPMIREEMLRLTDRYTDELFLRSGVASHINKVSRLVMDPERFRSDDDEPMSRKGLGLAYTRTSDGRLLRVLTPEGRTRILDELYDPYHQAFSDKVDQILAESGTCLIIDAHSFPSRALPYEDDQDSPRPDICLGFEPFHADAGLVDGAVRFFEKNDLAVALNFPYAGSMVPIKHYHKDPRVHSLMIEVNRALYMNEANGQKNSHFSRIRSVIWDFYDVCAATKRWKTE